ncbi:MAG: hypothetical protein HeimAB125_19260 [Candidatus Heimdallarchaeota archaeon AB_125]|nr:MAG: hypothetical protein HeimAB125_19260 [Candidatus Heimdallarchaeota archaeon AB_125]
MSEEKKDIKIEEKKADEKVKFSLKIEVFDQTEVIPFETTRRGLEEFKRLLDPNKDGREAVLLEELIEEMLSSINKSEIILLSTPLYIDCAPANTIRLMDIISEAVKNGKVTEKKRYLLAIACAGFLEYYHNLLALKMYEQFAKLNGFIWAGGLPIGAAGTYTLYGVTGLIEKIAPLPEEDIRHKIYAEPAKILVEVINAAAENISSGKTIPKEELKKLEVLSMPLEMYINGGNQNWIDWAKRIETEDKLRDKPYEK